MFKKIIKVSEDISIQQYSNGSYAWYDDKNGWRNIPKGLAEILINQKTK